MHNHFTKPGGRSAVRRPCAARLPLVLAFSFACAVLTTGCSSPAEPDGDDYVLVVRLASDTSIPLSESSRVRFDLWGYSERVADAPATRLETFERVFSRVPQAFELRFGADEFDTIDFRAGEPGEFGYYVTFDTDVDADGCYGCPGDYRWDYDKTDMTFFPETGPLRNVLEIQLTPVAR